MAAFTLTQTNRTNRAITPEFVLIEPNMTSVNTPQSDAEPALAQEFTSAPPEVAASATEPPESAVSASAPLLAVVPTSELSV